MSLTHLVLAATLALGALALVGCPKRTPAQQLAGALGRGDDKKVDALVQGGQPLTQTFPGGATALHVIAGGVMPDAALAKRALAAGVDPAAKNDQGQTAWEVVWSSRGGMMLSERQCDVLAALLEAGYRPSAPPTLVEVAERCQSAAFVQRFVKDLALAVDARDENGWTALHHAAFKGNYEASEGLLQAGANANAETTKTIEEKQVRGGETELVVERLEAGSRPLDLYHRRWTRGTPDYAALFAKHGGAKNDKVKNRFR